MLQECLAALQLCVNLRSFSWTDSGTLGENDDTFVAHLDILQQLFVTDLTVKISAGVSPTVWAKLMQMKRLQTFGLSTSHCTTLEGLFTWAEWSSHTMTHLEFSVISKIDHYPKCTFVAKICSINRLNTCSYYSIAVPSKSTAGCAKQCHP